MKIKIYQPYLYYDIRYIFTQPKPLLELETLILTFIIYSNNQSQNLLNYLKESLKLNDKWDNMLIEIIEQMNNVQINYDNEIKIKDLLIGDIDINNSIKNNIKNDEYIGFDTKEISKEFKYILNLINTKYLNEINQQNIIYLNNLPQWSINFNNNDINNKLSINNNQIQERLVEKFEEHDKNNILKKIIIKNEDEFNQNQNICFLEKNFNANIDLDAKNIEILDEDFYNTMNFTINLIQPSTLDQNIELNLIQDQLYSLVDLDLKTFNYENLLNSFDEYSNIKNLKKQWNEVFIDDNNLIIYKGMLIWIGIIWDIFNLNKKYKLKFPLISYHILDKNELKIILNNKYNLKNINVYWLNVLSNLNNDDQINEIKNYIFSNYKEYYNDNKYKNWIIDNINKINIDQKWLLSNLVDYNNFIKICKNINLDNKNNIFLSSINLDSDSISIEKINHLHNQYKISYKDIGFKNIEITQIPNKFNLINDLMLIKSYDEFEQKQDIYNKLNEYEKEIKVDEIKNQYKEKIKLLNNHKQKLLTDNRQKLVSEIINIFNEQIKGHIDAFLDKYIDDEKIKFNKDKIKYIKHNKKLDEETIKKIEWINDQRNKYSHETNKKLSNDLLKIGLEDLKKFYKILIENIKILK